MININEYNLTAYCGLYCGDCIRYQSKASDLAKDIIKEFGNTKFTEYAKVKRMQLPQMENYETMIQVLAVISTIKCEISCRQGGDGCGGSCQIKKCIKEKMLDGCWLCADFETCDKLKFLKPFHGEAPINNLRKIKELGTDSWAKHRDKCYPWL